MPLPILARKMHTHTHFMYTNGNSSSPDWNPPVDSKSSNRIKVQKFPFLSKSFFSYNFLFSEFINSLTKQIFIDEGSTCQSREQARPVARRPYKCIKQDHCKILKMYLKPPLIFLPPAHEFLTAPSVPHSWQGFHLLKCGESQARVRGLVLLLTTKDSHCPRHQRATSEVLP